MTDSTKTEAIDQWRKYYHDLEPQVRDLLRMSEVTRHYINDVDWPSECTEEESREVNRVLFLVGRIADMAENLEKSYDEAFPGARAKSAA